MELAERINVLVQAAEHAQSNGALSFDEAVIAKQAIDALKRGESLKAGSEILVKIAQIAQKKGVYTLRDSYYIYMASDGIEELIPEEDEE